MTDYYQPYNSSKYYYANSSNGHFEGMYWKSMSQWKKNRPLCGARCRNSLPCKAKAVVDKMGNSVNGRCRLHGGLSSGPKTLEGKAKSREAGRQGLIRYWERKRLSDRSSDVL